MTKGCHTVERTSCIATTNNNADIVQKVLNSKIEVDFFPELYQIETCVKDITFPLWKGTVNPPEKTCPTYKCDKLDGDLCVVMKGNEYGKNSTLQVCPRENQTCIFNEALVIANENLNVTCTDKKVDVPKRLVILIKLDYPEKPVTTIIHVKLENALVASAQELKKTKIAQLMKIAL